MVLLLFVAATGGRADGWKLVWHDEFNRDGPPDRANWDFERGFVRNEEAQWYQPENAVCKKGLLIIEARREHKPNPEYRPDGRGWKNREFIEYTSACLVTRHKREFTYGKIEMRARIDTRAGSWPAFWTLGANVDTVGWPKCGEINIMEYYRAGSWPMCSIPTATNRNGHRRGRPWKSWAGRRGRNSSTFGRWSGTRRKSICWWTAS